MNTDDLKFTATVEKGEVSALLLRPDGATHLLVLGHGASTNMRHATMERIAEAMDANGIATFRYNFPYSENGTARNSTKTCVETIRNAVKAANASAPDLTLLAGGHSFGGRMTTTTAQSEESHEHVKGIVLFSFPLHMPGKPDTERAVHLAHIDIPMLFLSGTRDELATRDLLELTIQKLGKRATLHKIETANHGYKILKKTRVSTEDVFDEMARVTREWADKL
ncbi:MAG: cutinase family protein, partial [Blastocatellia bacterium]|nr:cutinase family protein [Blastocatellia bacterium]